MPKRLTPAQREEIVLMLESQETTRMTDTQIGARVSGGGVSGTTVSKIRQSMREAYAQADEVQNQNHNGNGNGSFHANISPLAPLRLDERLPHIADATVPDPPKTGAIPDLSQMSPEAAAQAAKQATLGALPSLSEGTQKFLNDVGGPIAAIVVAVATWASPDIVKPAIPDPEIARLLLVAPARILARHTHLAIDEMSEDGRDIAVIVTALGTWALEVRNNYAELARQRRESVAPSRYDRPSRQGDDTRDTGSDRARRSGPGSGGAGYPSGTVAWPDRPGIDPAGASFFNQFAIRGQGQPVPPNGTAYPTRGTEPTPSDTEFGRSAIGTLYQVDAIGRRRQGLQ